MAQAVPLFRRQAFQLDVSAAQLQLLRHLFHRREAHRLHHLAGIARAGVVHQPRQTLLPAQAILHAHRSRGGVAVGALAAIIFHLQRLIQPRHHEEDHKAKRQPHNHRRVLQSGNAVSHQHPQGQQADDHRPEDAQPVWRIAVDILQLRSEVTQHQRPGIRGGHVEQQAGNGGDRSAKGKRRILRQQVIEAALRVGDRLGGEGRIAVDDFIQRAIAEHRQPQQGKGKRDNQRSHHKLTNGAST